MTEHAFKTDCRLLVFTDLDGTLLDHETYSFERALPAVKTLQERNIPLIICTSKTRAEIEMVRSQLQNSHPFISENGGAVFIPKGYFTHKFNFMREDPDYLIIELGTPYSKLREAIKKMRSLTQGKVKGFGDLDFQEVAHLCKFSLEQAELAKKREYDEPFVLEDDAFKKKIQEIARLSKLKITRGGRFYHLTGQNDKGKAILTLKNIYKEKSEKLKTIAAGDSSNDLPMLKAVDYPILVKKPDGSYDPAVKLDNIILASGAGPTGWTDALLKLFDKLF